MQITVFKDAVGRKLPRMLSIWRIVRISKGRFSFSGWGMYTDTFTTPPWNSIFDGIEVDSAKGFHTTNQNLKMLLDQNQFKLSQFSHLTLQSTVLDVLAWRHYIVYWSALSAAKATKSHTKNLVEAGTCDGLTAYFAMTAIKNLGVHYKCFMYDSWKAMKDEDLLSNEKSKAGMYSYLDLKVTIQNLKDFSNVSVFREGYIPDSFDSSENPDEIVWLHIDLNAALPTHETLAFFFNRMASGGIFLFDDYGSHDHKETKRVVDDFFQKKNVSLLQMPTGQALVFKL